MTNTANNGCALPGQKCHAESGEKDQIVNNPNISRQLYRWIVAAMHPRRREAPTQSQMLRIICGWLRKKDIFYVDICDYEDGMTGEWRRQLYFQLYDEEGEGDCHARNSVRENVAVKMANTIALAFDQEVKYECGEMEQGLASRYAGLVYHAWIAADVGEDDQCIELAEHQDLTPLLTIERITWAQPAPRESVIYTVEGDLTVRSHWIGGSRMYAAGQWLFIEPDGSRTLLSAKNKPDDIEALIDELEESIEVYGPYGQDETWIYRAMYRAGICPPERRRRSR